MEGLKSMDTRIYPVIVNTLKMEQRNLTIYYPQVTCLLSPNVQESINRNILTNVYMLIQNKDIMIIQM